MEEDDESGFREIDHTADWQVEVWAPGLGDLLEQAAAGMYEMIGIQYGSEVQATRRFELERPDRETILVQFLSELLFLLQTEHLAFRRFDFKFDEDPEVPVSVLAVGQPIRAIDKEIKAVTWHDMSVDRDDDGFRARITFDV